MVDELQEKLSFNLDNIGDTVIAATAIMCFIMIFAAGNALAFAMVTALLATASLLYILLKAKDTSRIGAHVWNFCMKNRVTSDVIISAGFIFAFGTSTAIALASGGAAAIMTSWFLNVFHSKIGIIEIPKKGDKNVQTNATNTTIKNENK